MKIQYTEIWQQRLSKRPSINSFPLDQPVHSETPAYTESDIILLLHHTRIAEQLVQNPLQGRIGATQTSHHVA